MANTENQLLIRPAWVASGLLAAVAVLAAVWLRFGLIGSEQWPINWLEVEGELDRTTTAQVRGAAGPEAARGFFAVDMAGVRAAVEELPWVARADVSRQWPDTLSVTIHEHRPVARWNETGLISRHGELFDVAGTSGMQGLPRLQGPDSRRVEVLETWLDMRRRLEPAGLDIDAVVLDARGAWELELDGGMVVVLGRARIAQRLDRFVAVYERLREREGPVTRVDLRYTNGLAVRSVRRDREIELAESGDDDHHG